MCIYIYIYRIMGCLGLRSIHPSIKGVTRTVVFHRVPLRTLKHERRPNEQALVCLSNREIVDASRGRTIHCQTANNRFFLIVSA